MNKFFLNYGINTLRVLGLVNYIILLINTILKMKKIIQQKKLIPIDNTFKKISLKLNKNKFFINIEKINNLCQEKDTFGLIREIFFRNVYLKDLNQEDFKKTICIDLGSNKGIFSVIASKTFKFVICVDFQKKFNKCIDEIMSSNNQKNYEIINGVMGNLEFPEISNKSALNQRILNLNELIINKTNGEKIFLKIDIEGGEFKLFDEIDLKLVDIIVMEVHIYLEEIQHHYDINDLKKILDKLNNNGFKYLCFSENLDEVNYPDKGISFVKAVKKH
jgi:FkbM family methyltransferase